jgi:hypothetical protein
MRLAIGSCIAAIVMSGWSTIASAQSRPDSLTMTCEQASALVRSRGAIVLGTGPNVFDRYVANGRFCTFPDVAEPAWVTTRDKRQCMVGFRCKPATDFFMWD